MITRTATGGNGLYLCFFCRLSGGNERTRGAKIVMIRKSIGIDAAWRAAKRPEWKFANVDSITGWPYAPVLGAALLLGLLQRAAENRAAEARVGKHC